MFIADDDTLYVTDSTSNSRNNPGWKRGIYVGSAQDGSVTAFIPDPDLQQIWAGGVLRKSNGEVLARLPGGGGGHGTTVTETGDVFVAQLSGQVQKFVKQ